MNQIQIQKEILFAGKCTFTISNPQSRHHTFRISKVECNDKKTRYFAGVLAGPENEIDYKYIGMVFPDNGNLHFTSKSNLPPQDERVKVLEWILKLIFKNKDLPDGYKIELSKDCAKCGRLLTTMESIERGIGPECAQSLSLS